MMLAFGTHQTTKKKRKIGVAIRPKRMEEEVKA
jgi:hypothetical protein